MRAFPTRTHWFLFCLIAATHGCGGGNAVPQQASQQPSVKSSATSPVDPVTQAASSGSSTNAAATETIELQELTWEQLQSTISSHQGKVIVIDIWSTSCEPCLREFPHLVALQQRYPEDVVCVSFDCDFIGAKNKPVAYYRERVLKQLTTMNASKVVNAMSTVAADELFQQLDLDSIPAVYVFDRSGQLAKRFDNRTPASATEEGISYELQIDPLVAQLVKANG